MTTTMAVPSGERLLPRLSRGKTKMRKVKMKFHAAVTAVAILLAPMTASAATKDGSFAVRGIGSQPCKAVVAAVADKEQGRFASEILGSWIAGYLSHSNRMATGVYELMPVSDTMVVAQMVVNVCKANPDIMVEPAVAMSIKSLMNGRQTTVTPIVTLENGKYATQIRKGLVLSVQQELEKLELLPPGSADGDYGPKTRDALIAFQRSKNLAETGIPDPGTVINLFFSE